MNSLRLSRTRFAVGLTIATVIYAALSLYQINLPGLHYDEAFEAVPTVQLLTGQPVTAFRNSGLTVGDKTFPLMTQDYIGAVNTYAAIPFIMVLGATPAALRVMSIIMGAITLGLTAVLALGLTGQRWVGLVAAFYLAVDPTFIFWNRQGVFVTAITATIGMGATYCWLRRLQGGSWQWSIAGAFLFGLGLYAKLLFIWLIAALIATVIVLNLATLVQQRTRFLAKLRLLLPEVAGIVLAFLLGCWPLVAYNLQTGGTLLNISENAATSYYGVNNLAFGPNLWERIGQFSALIGASHLWYLGRVIWNGWSVLVFGGVLVGVVSLAMRMYHSSTDDSDFSPIKSAFFPFLVIGFVVLTSIVTVSALWITHFAVLMAWPALAIAVGCWFIQNYAHWTFSRILAWFIWGSLALLLVTNFSTIIRYHAALTESGGLSAHSDAVYDLSDWLSQHAQGQVVAMDWGLAAPVTYLTYGRVQATEVFGYSWQSDTQLTQRLQGFIAQPDALYLWRTPEEIIFDRSSDFKALYRPQNLEETIEQAFYERSGRPLLGVTRLVAVGTATNPPQ